MYCEKVFSDRATLMDHMRKRNHREVNPKNNYYDKFYIINYLVCFSSISNVSKYILIFIGEDTVKLEYLEKSVFVCY